MAQQEKDPDSILNYYRKLLKVRKENPIIIYGDYEEHYHESNEIYCYERNFNGQKALIVCSFADHTITFRAPKGFDLTKGEVLISNYHDAPAKKTYALYVRMKREYTFINKQNQTFFGAMFTSSRFFSTIYRQMQHTDLCRQNIKRKS